MPTVAEVFERDRHLFGSVPKRRESHTCPYCFGTVTNYAQCYGCLQYFVLGPVPSRLRGQVVPMTTVFSPSGWYTRLWNYKRLQPNFQPTLAALAWIYLDTHAADIAELLGGDPTVATIVPSTRPGISYTSNALVKAMKLIGPLGARFTNAIEHDGKTPIEHMGGLDPDAFVPGESPVAGERVLLLEDTWISGSRALSAAMALLDWGADALVIMPLARMCDPETANPSYVDAARRPYDPADWPL